MLIDAFDPSRIDCAAYTLCVGEEIYVSPDQKIDASMRHTKQLLSTDEGFTIPPGQFAFLLTSESVKVPVDAIAFISIKARLKFSGLINISGFHVDPGYEGRLLFSVLNAGPKPLHRANGQPLFLIWYAYLDGSTSQHKTEHGFEKIESSVLNGISGEILSLQSLSEELRALEDRLTKKIREQEVETAKSTQLRVWIVRVGTGLLLLLIGWGLKVFFGGI